MTAAAAAGAASRFRRPAMIKRYKPIRAFESARPIDIYRVAGRRPSDVWVDAQGRIAEPGPEAQPLKELVYWRTQTGPGDQIQEHLGGFFLVTLAGDIYPIALCPPKPLAPETAFAHAQAIRSGDDARIEELILAGDILQVEGRTPKGHASRPADRLVAATHALVVDERPEDIDARPAVPPRSEGWARRGQ